MVYIYSRAIGLILIYHTLSTVSDGFDMCDIEALAN